MRQFGHTSILILLIFVAGACQTMPVDNFPKVKVNMTKDEVLELVGSPNRTERFEGKDKWAYRFYTDETKDKWDQRQVTFIDGKVVSVGEDIEEENRLKAINDDDRAREERRKNFKSGAAQGTGADGANGAAGTGLGTGAGASGLNTSSTPSVPDPVAPNESDFVEMKGRRGPVNGDNSGNK